MKKKLQVFVSSTYTDMLSERQAVVEAILRAGHIPAGMELFAAGDESQWETIRRWIDDSDVFMLILGGRYGSIEPKSGKSYIELEYQYASEKKKPLFAAVIEESYLTAKVKADGPNAMERFNGNLLNVFRETVTKKICRFFGDSSELKVIVLESLLNFERNEDLAGWIRSSDAIDPKITLEELVRLQTENSSLQKKVKELEAVAAVAVEARQKKSGANILSEDAKTLLTAAKNSDGHILYSSTLDEAIIQVANKNFIDPPQSHREEVRWKAAIEELLGPKLIEKLRAQSETSYSIFQLTKRGYDIADEIEGSQAGMI
ncbi:MAG: DUF4062 domain-containing protein [Deltaproteobacteria bacterium]|nr:DUF4062 domain-containing protein [Deltaproteobacteria bacterium]